MMQKNRRSEAFSPATWGMMGLGVLVVSLVCVSLGSVSLPLHTTWQTLFDALLGREAADSMAASILVHVRTPRVLAAALSGAALSLCGAAMQGLLRNPLADGSTLGVSSGASLGAVLALAFGFHLPGLPHGGPMVLAIVFAFLSMLMILALAYAFDRSFSTHTIILVGVIFSMFVSSLITLVIAFSGEKLHSITFWSMGSLAASDYVQGLLLLITLIVCGGLLSLRSRELNAFALGEENAHHIGIHVKSVKLQVLICVSALIGVAVSIGGTIAFVGLIIPHMVRALTGPNHRRLLPASAFAGAGFLMLCDLLARTILSPVELPIGVVTSLIGAATFVAIIFNRRRKGMP
ncbi:MAG: FecCD family ABC transporter permease [Christensenellales bacterium]